MMADQDFVQITIGELRILREIADAATELIVDSEESNPMSGGILESIRWLEEVIPPEWVQEERGRRSEEE
jgi:hypothetical protein